VRVRLEREVGRSGRFAHTLPCSLIYRSLKSVV
jgi:hypothetical protein